MPGTLYYNVWSEPSYRNYVRKSPKDFGWDWGPSYGPTGIQSISVGYEPKMSQITVKT